MLVILQTVRDHRLGMLVPSTHLKKPEGLAIHAVLAVSFQYSYPLHQVFPQTYQIPACPVSEISKLFPVTVLQLLACRVHPSHDQTLHKV